MIGTVGIDAGFYAENEYDRLVTVCIRMPAGIAYDPGTRRSAVLKRQKQHYEWGAYDVGLVRSELEQFAGLLRDLGVQVVMLDDTTPCLLQHFPRDLGFVVGGTLFLGRLKSPARQGEADDLLRRCAGREDVCQLESGTIEGGDVMLNGGVVYVGLSEETSPAGAEALQRALAGRGEPFVVEPISFGHDGVLHLDTVFNVVAPQIALVRPTAFTRPELRLLESRFDLIAMSEAESRRVEINTLSIGSGTVLIKKGSDRLESELQRRGLTSIQVELTETSKLPGSIRCCTLPLERASVQNSDAKR